MTEKLRVAPGLERIVHHCLEKKPADRFQSARDLSFALGVPLRCHRRHRARRRPAVSRPQTSLDRHGGGGAAVRRQLAAFLYTCRAMRRRAAGNGTTSRFPVPNEVSHLAISLRRQVAGLTSSPGDTGLPKIYVQRSRFHRPSARSRQAEGASYPVLVARRQLRGVFRP